MVPRAIGLTVLTIGALFRYFAFRELRKVGMEWNEIAFIGVPKVRATKGLYRLFHHPAYIGTFMGAAGLGMMALGWGGFIVFIGMVPFLGERMIVEKAIRVRQEAGDQFDSIPVS